MCCVRSKSDVGDQLRGTPNGVFSFIEASTGEREVKLKLDLIKSSHILMELKWRWINVAQERYFGKLFCRIEFNIYVFIKFYEKLNCIKNYMGILDIPSSVERFKCNLYSSMLPSSFLIWKQSNKNKIDVIEPLKKIQLLVLWWKFDKWVQRQSI